MITCLIKCELCGLNMKNRLNGSHLKRIHNISLNDYINKFPNSNVGKLTSNVITYNCKVCNKKIKGSQSLSRHVKTHKETLESYYVKYYCNNTIPLCKCGCNNNSTFKNIEIGFHDYIHNHSSPFIKNNKEYKKRKSFIAWNVGLKKTTDIRVKKNSDSIKKSWNPEKLKKRSKSYKQTMLKKYGVENGFQSNIIKEKSKNTLLKTHGVENPQFSNYIKYKWKNYTLPSGKIVRCQGYEPFGFNILLKEYNESEIINDRTLIPKIKYIENQKERIHCPDFYIKSNNLLIDVKSNYTYNLHKVNMSLKQNAAIQCGFKYKIYIFNDNGTLNKII